MLPLGLKDKASSLSWLCFLNSQAQSPAQIILTYSGRKIVWPARGASLAQLAEQLTLNQWVRGSNPRRCTRF